VQNRLQAAHPIFLIHVHIGVKKLLRRQFKLAVEVLANFCKLELNESNGLSKRDGGCIPYLVEFKAFQIVVILIQKSIMYIMVSLETSVSFVDSG
jgi:hypothetical protein